jgi:hypothetical protein
MHNVCRNVCWTAFNVQDACAILCRLLCMVLGCVEVLILTWVHCIHQAYVLVQTISPNEWGVCFWSSDLSIASG